MVNIENTEELQKIKKSNYGFVTITDSQSKVTIHKSNCAQITEKEYLQSKKIDDITKFHWFSTFALAEKEFGNILSCKVCKP